MLEMHVKSQREISINNLKVEDPINRRTKHQNQNNGFID